MHTGPDATIRLLIVNQDAEAAQAVVSNLRNAGMAIRPSRADDLAAVSELLAAQPFDLILLAAADSTAKVQPLLQLAAAGGRDLPVLVELEAIDTATVLQVSASGARALVVRGEFDHLRSVIEREYDDLDARRGMRRLQAQLRETERRCDSLIESSRDPIAYVHEGMYIRANSAYLDMFGYEAFEDIEGMSLLDMVAPAHVADFKRLLKEIARGEPPPPRYELEARDADGGNFPAVMEFAQAKYEGEPCIQVIIRRQESDPALAREVEELRRRDMATGLLNRQTLLHHLEQRVGETATEGHQHALLLIEPDNAAQLERQVGLDNIDALAAAIAERLRQASDANADIARMDANSYAVLLPGSDYANAAASAERLRAAFQDAVLETAHASLSATVSIGGVQIGERIAQVAQVLAKANESLHTAAGMGGNRVEIFDPSADERVASERVRAHVAHLRDAVENDQLTLAWQAIANLEDQSQIFFEALPRLPGSDGHPILPAQFMPLAEEHGLAAAVDHWTLRRALAAGRELVGAGTAPRVMVELSPRTLEQDNLGEDLRRLLAESGLPAQSLVLELPESKVFTNLRPTQRLVEAVRALGAGFCISEFGIGLNSQQLLSHLKPDYVKLHGELIEAYASSGENRERVREIVAQAREHAVACIADGVADAGSMTMLYTDGVALMQGDFIAPVGDSMSGNY